VRRALPIPFFSLIAFIVPATSQTPATPPKDSDIYILQLQRVQAGQDTCILVRNDSEYHYERETRDKVEIFEGTFVPSGTQVLRGIVNDEAIKSLTQDKIVEPISRREADVVSIALLRPSGWQYLRFPDSTSRTPFNKSLDPLLELVAALRKQPHTLLPEATSRNNCLPPGEIALKKRPVETATNPPSLSGSATAPAPLTAGTAPAEAPAKFLFRLEGTTMDTKRVQRSCVILYPDGKYHRESKEQSLDKKVVKVQVFEDAVEAAALLDLRVILNDPKLWNRPHEEPPQQLAMETGKFAFLSAPIGGQVKKVTLWNFFGFTQTGPWSRPDSHDNGMKLLKPLEQWMTAHVEGQKTPPTDTAPATNCTPPN